jgi:hypothetical protein
VLALGSQWMFGGRSRLETRMAAVFSLITGNLPGRCLKTAWVAELTIITTRWLNMGEFMSRRGISMETKANIRVVGSMHWPPTVTLVSPISCGRHILAIRDGVMNDVHGRAFLHDLTISCGILTWANDNLPIADRRLLRKARCLRFAIAMYVAECLAQGMVVRRLRMDFSMNQF